MFDPNTPGGGGGGGFLKSAGQYALPAAMFLGQTLGGLFGGQAAEKDQQLGRDQFQFGREQTLRGNDIQSFNVGRMNPLIEMLLMRARERQSAPQPAPYKLAPPTVNNPYQKMG